MGRLESDKQVYVIGHPTDPFRKPAQPPKSPAQILVKTSSPFRVDERLPILRAEDDMIMQAEIG
jgi:hypothetical protein